jgi:hypothetical protein
MAEAAGLRPDHVWSVTPGDYAARPPDVEHHEFLLVATRSEEAPDGQHQLLDRASPE